MTDDNTLADIIDLTEPLENDIIFSLSNTVICIDSDDSFNLSSVPKQENKAKENKKSSKNKKNKSQNLDGVSKKITAEKNYSSFGECPICCEELGKNPLASTICGHVYCLKCLKRALQFEKKCPTCRNLLTQKLSYHPLYLRL